MNVNTTWQNRKKRQAAAVRAGIEDCVQNMGADSQTFAIPVSRKWARLMTDLKNKKGWPVVFPEKRGLYSTLRSLHEGIYEAELAALAALRACVEQA